MEIILGKYGELALKGLNKNAFEAPMIKTIRKRLRRFGDFHVYSSLSTVYVEPLTDSCDIDRAYDEFKRIFGLSAVGRAAICEKDLDEISRCAVSYLGSQLANAKTFKVKSKRADKKFPMTSMELSAEVGAYILDNYPHLTVDVENPELEVICEVRDSVAVVHATQDRGAGGIPNGTGGRVACMLSGGIDSPVAAWMMARRGCEIVGVHFMSPPYTGEGALYKVERLAGKVARWSNRFPLYEVPFTDCQVMIRDNAPEDLFTVLMRRSMLRITQMLAEKEECGAVVTGESLGQVASQTLKAIQCTDDVAHMPVFRPLIGTDKIEITALARRIDTFDISIEPYEDCCTIFTPKHPRTRPSLDLVIQAEKEMPDLQTLEEEAFKASRFKMFRFDDEVSL